MCDAIVEDYEHGTSYIQGFTVPKDKQCSKKATVQIGDLKLCKVHGRLCKEGFMHQSGQVESRQLIRDTRDFNREKPNDWALDLPVVDLVLSKAK